MLQPPFLLVVIKCVVVVASLYNSLLTLALALAPNLDHQMII